MNLIEIKVANAQARYKSFLSSLQGQLIMETSATATPVSRFAENIHKTLKVFLEYEQHVIANDVEVLARRAYEEAQVDMGVKFEDPQLPGDIVEHLNAGSEWIYEQIALQAHRDVGVTKESKRIFSLGRLMDSKSFFAGKQSFYYRDRAGRKMPADKYIKAVFRKSFLAVWNEVYMYAMTKAGHDTAYVMHPDEKSKKYGIEIALTSKGRGVPYMDIREDVFHPNSRARVVAELPIHVST